MKNTPKVNEVLNDDALLKRYRKEILDLKKQLEEVCNKYSKIYTFYMPVCIYSVCVCVYTYTRTVVCLQWQLFGNCFKPRPVKSGGVGKPLKLVIVAYIQGIKIENKAKRKAIDNDQCIWVKVNAK